MKYIKTYEVNNGRYDKWPIIHAINYLFKDSYDTSISYAGISFTVEEEGITIFSKDEYIEIFISNTSQFFDNIIPIFNKYLEDIAWVITLDMYYASFKIKKKNIDKAINIFRTSDNMKEEIKFYSALNKYNI
jgi:hypothetical protein